MEIGKLIDNWFQIWESGNFSDLPISDHFVHISPFGTIKGKKAYMDLVNSNRDKFLGYRFTIHDKILEQNKACVQYTGVQGDFRLDVSEWYYIKENLIEKIIAYYHIGEIRDERKLKENT